MKKTKMSSRRRRTLRRVLIAAAAVLLVNRIFLIGLLFPIQALRHIEERTGTGRTAVVCPALLAYGAAFVSRAR